MTAPRHGDNVECPGGYVGVHDDHQGPDRATCPSCGRSIGFHRITGKFRRHKPPKILRGTWHDPAIVNDPRISDQDVRVRITAERLHANESMHMHQYIGSVICPYCALRASRVLRWVGEYDRDEALSHDTPWGLVSQSGRGNVKEPARNFTLPDPNASSVEDDVNGRSTDA